MCLVDLENKETRNVRRKNLMHRRLDDLLERFFRKMLCFKNISYCKATCYRVKFMEVESNKIPNYCRTSVLHERAILFLKNLFINNQWVTEPVIFE